MSPWWMLSYVGFLSQNIDPMLAEQLFSECSILKKGDATICSNYRGISLLTIANVILSSLLCERLKPFVDKQIGSYQCGFRPGKSTIDQIFTLRQILEKIRDKQINTFHLFVDLNPLSTLYIGITYMPPCLS